MTAPLNQASNTKHRAVDLRTILLLPLASLAILFLAVFATDRLIGLSLGRTQDGTARSLVFPPNTEELFPTVEFDMLVRTNEFGLRDTPVAAKSESVYRIAIVGDSFTFGWGVPQGAAWVEVLEQELQATGARVELLNLGKPGAGIPQYVEILERAIPVLQPDLVVLALLQGDDLGSAWRYTPPVNVRLGRLTARLFPHIVRMLWQHGGQDTVSNAAMAGASQTREERRAAFAQEARRWLEQLGTPQREAFERIPDEVKSAALNGEFNLGLVQMAVGSPDFMMNVARTESGFFRESSRDIVGALHYLKAFAAIHGSELAVASMPHGIYVNRPAMKNYARLGMQVDEALLGSDLPDAVYASACESADIPFLSATTAFRERVDDDSLYYRLDGHWTAAGNRLYAMALKEDFFAMIPSKYLGGTAR
ncbi:MAG: hypothetical protein RLZZ303_996 [Candidatus Hydrogenedentota bacterium]|jgi:hypothetical protein